MENRSGDSRDNRIGRIHLDTYIISADGVLNDDNTKIDNLIIGVPVSNESDDILYINVSPMLTNQYFVGRRVSVDLSDDLLIIFPH